MRRRTIAILGLTAAGAVVVSLTHLKVSGEKPRPSLEQTDSTAAPPLMAGMPAYHAPPPSAPPPAGLAGNGPPPSEEGAAPDLDPETRRQNTQRLIHETMEAHLNADLIDGEWKARTEDDIRSVFATPPVPGATLLSVQCASTMCRAIVATNDVDAQRGLPHVISQAPPFDNEVYYHYDGGRTTMYLARAEYTLPRPQGL